MSTKIEWATETWNPITGCTKISEGCKNCYAERMSKRLAGRYGYPKDEPFKVTFHPDRIEQPLKWKNPRRIFVCSMGDLFHKDVDPFWIDQILNIAAICNQHTFIILTKRPENIEEKTSAFYHNGERKIIPPPWFSKNIWLGVTAENQQRADERIPILLQIPASVRFVSVEPMLGPVDLSEYLYMDGAGWLGLLHWVICGGESGPGARPMHTDWARSLRDQCVASGTPYFFKQWGEWIPTWQGFSRAHRTNNSKQFKFKLNGITDNPVDGHSFVGTEGGMSFKVGKKAAGRILDGKTWDQYPEV